MEINTPNTMCWVCGKGEAFVLGTPEMTELHPYYKSNTSQAVQAASHVSKRVPYPVHP
jgi:hypothetical protein